MKVLKKILKYFTIIFIYVVLLNVLKMVLPCDDDYKVDTKTNNVSYAYKV